MTGRGIAWLTAVAAGSAAGIAAAIAFAESLTG